MIDYAVVADSSPGMDVSGGWSASRQAVAGQNALPSNGNAR